MSNIDLNEVVRFIEEGLDKNAVVRYLNLPIIHGPKSAIFVVFQNLIINGLKYNHSERPKVEISSELASEHLLIRFQDNGIGIDPAYFKKIFEMFKRLNTRDEFEGSGIGLASCSKLIKKIKGDVFVENSTEQGSCFVVKLPKKMIIDAVGQNKVIEA